MSTFKPFMRITILSIILTSLLIYLGIKYHWVDHVNKQFDFAIELKIPNEIINPASNDEVLNTELNSYAPEIIKNNTSNTVLDSMNKEQITEQCVNLLSKQIKDTLTLELATVNCVVSNFQETFQNINVQNNHIIEEFQKKKLLIKQRCQQQFSKYQQNSLIEKQLLIGICVSDRLSTSK